MEEKSLKELVKVLYEDFLKYIDLKFDYYKLDLIERLVLLLTKGFSIAILFIVIPMTFFFLFMALAFFLGDLLGKDYWGFFIVAAAVFMVGSIFLLFRRLILTNPIINALIQAVFNPSDKKRNEKKKKKIS